MGTPGIALFILCGLVALISAVGTVVVKSPIRAAMSLLTHILALSGLFLTLHAHLLAVLQVLVYAGAIVVLFVFVIMLLGPGMSDPPTTRALVSRTTAAAVMGLLTFALVAVVAQIAPEPVEITACEPGAGADCGQFGGVSAFSLELFGRGMVPFELIGVLLTVAVVGSIAVARGRSPEEIATAKRRRTAGADGAAAESEGSV
jgi:NADH-quinone oxidoreductase subunit J